MEFYKLTSEKLAIKQAFDDRRLMITWKTKPSIINLYLNYNSIFNKKTKWSVKDDEAASKLNETDLQIIELGIIQTRSNKNYSGKIYSFSYYLNEIQNFLELNLPPESINIMLDVNRKRWKQATGKQKSSKRAGEYQPIQLYLLPPRNLSGRIKLYFQ